MVHSAGMSSRSAETAAGTATAVGASSKSATAAGTTAATGSASRSGHTHYLLVIICIHYSIEERNSQITVLKTTNAAIYSSVSVSFMLGQRFSIQASS